MRASPHVRNRVREEVSDRVEGAEAEVDEEAGSNGASTSHKEESAASTDPSTSLAGRSVLCRHVSRTHRTGV